MRTAITLLLNRPQLAQIVEQPQQLLALEEPGIRLLVELLELIQSAPHISCGAILEHWRTRAEGRHLSKLAGAAVTAPEEGLETEFKGALTLLDKQRIEQEYTHLLRKSETTPLTTDEKQRITQLQTEKRTLAQPGKNR